MNLSNKNFSSYFLFVFYSLLVLAGQVMSHGRMKIPITRLPSGDEDNGFTISKGPATTYPCANLPSKSVPADNTYKSGSSIQILFEITAAHQGKCFVELSTTGDSGDFKILKKLPSCANETGNFSRRVELPAGKTCDKCTLRWRWLAKTTEELYINCADIKIT
ncbi:hypothetical protein G9A89_004577 [Geosiphon pyriformis]|nr:hypothetical protein G9A89_004577 [Geosiphon pyriformis]